MTNELFNSIVLRLLDNVNDILEDEKKDPDSDFIKGEKLAYYIVLDIIKSRLELETEDYDLSSCGLDIDLDKMYM